ncbi:MAG: ComEC/Rec2 family competence protein [Armatimonadetes bacterium]|nr:ComEC/Rec2 family competence protein [Armatimonadota bacterium]
MNGPGKATGDPPLWLELAAAVRGRPVVLLALCVAGGIVLADVLCVSPWFFLPVLAVGLVFTIAVKGQKFPRVGLFMASVAVGAGLHALRITPGPGDISRLAGLSDVTIRATVLEDPQGPSWRQSMPIQVHGLRRGDGAWQRVSGRALVFCSEPKKLSAGDRAVFSGAAITLPAGPTNWHQRDRRRHLARQGIHTQVKAEYGERETGPMRRPAALRRFFRDAMSEMLRKAMPGRDSQTRRRDSDLLAGMVFGQAAVEPNRDVQELFRRTGTIHVLVVSGAQLSIIVMLILVLNRSRRNLSPWHLPLILPFLGFFAFIAGQGPSVWRALIMSSVFLTCLVRGRPYDLASSLSLAALALMISDTGSVFGAGAQMTFAATIGIALILPARRAPETGELVRNHGLKSAALGTLGAWLLVTPILIHYFNGFALTSSLANLIVVPISGIVVVVGLLAIIFGLFSTALCTAVCWVGAKLIGVIVWTNHLCAHIPGGFVDRISLSTGGCLLWLVLAALGIHLIKSGRLQSAWRKDPARLLTCAAIVLSGVCVVVAVRELWPRSARIVTFDVGEGQCCLLETPERQAILLDCGGRGKWSAYEIARDILTPYLLARGHRQIDLAVISHPDTDHYAALDDLARIIPVRAVLVGLDGGEETFGQVIGDLHATGSVVRVGARGTRLRAGSVVLRVLHPPADQRNRALWRDNDRSLVVMARGDGWSALFPGDVEKAAMRWMLEDPSLIGELAAQVFQAPHHGRSSADLPEFFATVAPRVAVVSRFGEPYERRGHESLSAICPLVRSTEASGAVCVELGREKLRVRTRRPQNQRPGRR